MNNTSPKYCLNCNTELHGKYCHACGQKSTHCKPTLKEFILEYFNIAFVWDRHLLKTMKQLLCSPGSLTKEYMSGKFISYTHPLKLNMFLLFVFITFFLLFHDTEHIGDSIKTLTRDETLHPLIQFELLANDEEYAAELKSSRLDTVQLYAPLLLSETLPEIFVNIDEENVSASDTIVVWTASVPRLLIEDGALVLHDDGYYHLNTEYGEGEYGTDLLEIVWEQMVKLATEYFPLIIILTAPFLSLVIRLLQRRRDRSHFKNFIFSLHYTAFLETAIISLYIVYLIVSPPYWLMQVVMIAGSCAYLTAAFKKVYEINSWINATGKALLTNVGYILILLMLFVCIFLIACATVAFNQGLTGV
jgi:hypothetical protein